MMSHQAAMIHMLKSTVFRTPQELEQYRMYISENDVLQFWDSLPLYKMEQLLTIHNYRIVQYLSQYINHYLNQKKPVAGNQAYLVKKQQLQAQEQSCQTEINRDIQTTQFYVYDCKIFKSPLNGKEENDLLNAFMVVWKHLEQNIQQQTQARHKQDDDCQLFQFIDNEVFGEATMIFKCKASAILKIFSFFKYTNIDPVSGDTIIIPQELYYEFLFSWMHCAQNNQIESMVKHLFKGLLILLQNSILLSFISQLSPEDKNYRKYQKPVCIIPKPNFAESCTMIENGLGDVEWNTLKIKAFNIKYNVVEEQNRFICYRVKEPEFMLGENQYANYEQEYLKAGDRSILEGFEKIRMRCQDNYQYY